MSATSNAPIADPSVAPDRPDLSDGQCIMCGEPTTHKCSEVKGFSLCHKITYCRKHCRSSTPADKAAIYGYTLTLDRKLIRIATILHEAFLAFLENTWSDDVIAAQVSDREILVHQGAPNCSDRLFVDFPQYLFATDEDAKRAVLTDSKCDMAFACLYPLITKLLQGLDMYLEGNDVKLANKPRQTITVSHNGATHDSQERHFVLRLECPRTARKWILDLAGAQYGIRQPLHILHHYHQAFGAERIGIWPCDIKHALLTKWATFEGGLQLSFGLPFRAGEALQNAAQTWERENGDLARVLELENEGFQRVKQGLLASLDEAVCSFVLEDHSAAVRQALEYEVRHPGEGVRRINRVMERLCEATGDSEHVRRMLRS